MYTYTPKNMKTFDTFWLAEWMNWPELAIWTDWFPGAKQGFKQGLVK